MGLSLRFVGVLMQDDKAKELTHDAIVFDLYT